MLFMNSNVIVRCKLYIGYTSRHLHQRVEKPSQTFRYWQAFLGKTQLKTVES